VGTRIEKTGIGPKERKESAEYVMRRERQLRTCGMDVACSEMRERDGKDPNEDGRDIRWMKEIWKNRDRMKKERGGRKKNVIFLELLFL
jgi:hypothetical protein